MSNELNHKDYVISKTKMPSYLEEFLGESEDRDEITLVFERNKVLVIEINDLHETLDSTTNSTLNLTGRPLEIDLSIPSYSIAGEAAPIQSDSNYKPMGINAARKFNNHYHRQRNEYNKPAGVYCVCDASDQKNVVVLGSHTSNERVVSRILIRLQGLVNALDQNMMNDMIKQHVINVGGVPKIEMICTSFYEIYGQKLNSSHNLESVYNSGYIGIEAEWKTNEIKIPHYGALINMYLQIVTGHRSSLLYNIYQKLLLMQTCIKLLGDYSLVDDLNLCQEFTAQEDICSNLEKVLHEVHYTKTVTTAQDIQQGLAYIQQSSLTDKLWNILSCSSTLVDLKAALRFLFNRISEKSVTVPLLEDDLSTVFGILIKSICDGGMIVSLTSEQSLVLLIELGLQKIKKALMFVAHSYDAGISTCLNDTWSKITSKYNMKPKLNDLDKFDSVVMFKQLNLLYSLYKILEFVQLIEQNCSLSKAVTPCVFKHAYNKFGIQANGSSIEDIKQLFELGLTVMYNDVKSSIDGLFLTKKVKMISTKKLSWCSSVITLFHISRNLIFPASVYNPTDIQHMSRENNYFLTLMEIYSDTLPV